VTAREIEGGGHNRVVGPDLLWRHSETDLVTAQLLYSDTETPERPELFSGWDGRQLSGHAAHLEWLHTDQKWTWRVTARDVDEDFRNDQGFLTQVGYRRGRLFFGRTFYPQQPLFRRLQVYTVGRRDEHPDGDLLTEVVVAGIGIQGSKNLAFTFEVVPGEQQRVGPDILERDYVFLFTQIDPGRRFSRIGIVGTVGEHIDFSHRRVGDGGDLQVFGTLKPTDHLSLEPSIRRRWLDVDAGSRSGRLFTAEIERLKATYNFSSRAFLRLIGEYAKTRRDPTLFAFPVASEDAGFAGSALFAYQINWQTVLYLGYGDERAQDLDGDLQAASRAVFLKVSYAFQR
jgi:hypothetical protein